MFATPIAYLIDVQGIIAGPVAVGVPAKAPVGASSVSPGGVLPAVTVNTYGGVPPLPAIVVVYANCTDARAAGVTPLYRGEPGYRDALDRDHDGVACE